MDTLWGPIPLAQWRRVPHTSGRVATEEDVKAGRAAFYLGNLDEVPARPAAMELPALAWWPQDDSGPRRLCVVIQAERSDLQCTLGVRFIDGGNGVCLLDDLDFDVGTLAG
jgi:hypothetical protein